MRDRWYNHDMSEEQQWIDILKEQPRKGERLLVRVIGGVSRIVTYNPYSYENWCITHYKRMPVGNERKV